jgi:Ca2+-transporting ATPase
MTTLHENENGVFVITKGAVEVIVDKLNEEQKKSRSMFIEKSNEMAEKGMRVLAFAVKKLPFSPENLIASEIEIDLTFIGLVGLMDPPRKSAKKAVIECKKAGIIPVMVTGDHLLTAKYIAKQIKILDKDDDLVLTGTELAEMPQKEFEKIVEKVRVYARMNPEQKLIIVKALQLKNQLVAMTGDGVNDAPALKIADIGIAMGINGTEVSKEAAHMILLDDNFSSIVYAIKTGRKIVDNLSKFIKYILAGNFGEIWVIFLAPLFGFPLPLLAIHILWINLITDGLPGLALAAEKPEETLMSRPPIPTDQKILNSTLIFHVVWVGFLIGSLSFGMQVWALKHNIQNWQTMVFSVLCFSQIWHVMAIRSSYTSTFKIGFFSNKAMVAAISIAVILQLLIIYIPFFNRTFQTNPLSTFELLLTVLVSSTVFWMVEAEKFLKRSNKKNLKEKGNEK